MRVEGVGFRFRVWFSSFEFRAVVTSKVSGFGCRVVGLYSTGLATRGGFRVNVTSRVQGFGSRVSGLGGWVETKSRGSGPRVWGLGFGVWGLRFEVWGLGVGAVQCGFGDFRRAAERALGRHAPCFVVKGIGFRV